ncbi:protein still life, isoforms C/SIF type 2-like [Teleopsis dalmanni]|uniref:protein still life, isoforms C/SIF type 2-like n=1 Tax=Teleopsis dalmanni TaxID=139649 RepID=UPI0018CE4A3C|nr:protein still life, isoforms C/SIF type 2-like [Teleopsis dalmanni]
MSLTTAVSDEDDGESVMASPYKAKATGTAASSFNCTGAVRKAGFLSVKKWLLRKKHQIELARKRGWKGYWVCLKGTTLLFYPCDSREGRSVEAAPKHLIIVDGAIMQPIPEHPKRDYIFCLSTAFGDAYLFQAPCQVSTLQSNTQYTQYTHTRKNSILIAPKIKLRIIQCGFGLVCHGSIANTATTTADGGTGIGAGAGLDSGY